MADVTRDDVRQLAQLSGIDLTDDELDRLGGDLGAILGYVDQLSELHTDGVEPTYQVTDLENASRDDEVDTGTVSRETLLSLAPKQRDNQIEVPKVL